MERIEVGVLHPGEMGAAVGRQLTQAGIQGRWLPRGRGPQTQRRAADAGLEPVADLGELVATCGVILSICPPAAAFEVAESVAATGFDGVYVDANAISPARSRAIADLLGTARVVDGGIVGPPPSDRGLSTRLCLSGPAAHTRQIADLFAGTALTPMVLDGPVGRASALKLAFASYNKITFALAAQAGALAAAHGVRDELQTLASDVLPNTPLAQPSSPANAAARAWRWAPEMREIADACAEVGIPAGIADAAAALFDRWERHRDDSDVPVERLLDDLRG